MATISDLPREILVHIFQFYLETEKQEGLITVLSCVSCYWKDVCTDRMLWTKYDGTLNFKKMMALSKKGYLNHTKELKLSKTDQFTDKDAKKLFSGMNNLNVVNFSQVNLSSKSDCLSIVAEACPNLREIHFSDYSTQHKYRSYSKYKTTFNYDRLASFLIIRGGRLLTINLSECKLTNMNQIIRCVADCCPNLEQLQLTHIEASRATFCTKYVQNKCPKLKVLHLDDNVELKVEKHVTGFQNLEVFTYYDSSGYTLTDKGFICVVFDSVNLKFLNLTNCSISTEIMCKLPACSVEYLYIANSKMCHSINLSDVLKRWSHSLKEVDISNASLNDVNKAILSLVMTPPVCPLQHLNLNSTKVTADIIEKVLEKCDQLEVLHLQSCRNLGRGMKRVYFGKSEFEMLRLKIKNFINMESVEE